MKRLALLFFILLPIFSGCSQNNSKPNTPLISQEFGLIDGLDGSQSEDSYVVSINGITAISRQIIVHGGVYEIKVRYYPVNKAVKVTSFKTLLNGGQCYSLAKSGGIYKVISTTDTQKCQSNIESMKEKFSLI